MRLASLLSFVGALALGGCGFVQQPSLALRSVEVQKGDAQELAASFHFDVTNPNPIALDVARSSYALSLNGSEVASSGEANIPLHLAAVGSSPLVLPITLRYEDVVSGAIGAVLGGGPRYEIEVVLGFDTKAGPLDVSVTQTGDLPTTGF